MVKISRTRKMQLRIRQFLRKSRHRAWRIHWRVTLVIVMLVLIAIGCVTYYFDVILPRSFKYSYYDHEIQDFIYYAIIPMIVFSSIALKLIFFLWDKQQELDLAKWKKEREEFRAKFAITFDLNDQVKPDEQSATCPNSSTAGKDRKEPDNSLNNLIDKPSDNSIHKVDVVVEKQSQEQKEEQPPISFEKKEQEKEAIYLKSYVIIPHVTKPRVVSLRKPVYTPVHKPRRIASKTEVIYHNYIKRENPYYKFLKARQSAVIHIQEMLDKRPSKGILGNAYLFTTDKTDSLFEDFSIVYGNQVLAVQITFPEPYLQKGVNLIRSPYLKKPHEWKWEREFFVSLCQQHRLIPCIYEVDPIALKPIDADGWNLRDALTEESIVPCRLVTAELIDMSEWEIQTQMIQFVREYLRQEEEGLKFYRDSGFWSGNVLWMSKKKYEKKWIIVKRVQKFTQLTDKQKENMRKRGFLLYRYQGNIAQIIYKKENTRGGLSPVDHPKRGVNYEMDFEGFQLIQ